MPTLLSIPREIRDEIYDWALLDTLPSSQSPSLQRSRKTITYSPSNPETHYGEQAVRYPAHTSLPLTNALLSTTRQLRHEFLESIKRLGSLRYKVDLTYRRDKGALAPTWISVPFLTDRIDVLEVQWRVRSGKTSSIASYVGDDETAWQGSAFCASVALLQRFVERGVYLLSKKKRRKIHIGLLEIHLNTTAEIETAELATIVEEIILVLGDWMVGNVVAGYHDDCKQREDAQFRLLAGKLGKMQLHSNGVLKHEWVLSEEVTKRDEAERVRNAADVEE